MPLTDTERTEDTEVAIELAGEFIFGWGTLSGADELLIYHHRTEIFEFVNDVDCGSLNRASRMKYEIICEMLGIKYEKPLRESPAISLTDTSHNSSDDKNSKAIRDIQSGGDELTEIKFANKPDFYKEGACRGLNPNVMYPETEEDEVIAKQICNQCGVQDNCLNTALERREKIGVWGGATERERRRIIRRRMRSA